MSARVHQSPQGPLCKRPPADQNLHALVYNQLLHTQVQMLQQQKWTFQIFFVSIYLPMFAQCDTWQSLLLIILFWSDLLFHMCEQSDVLT